jgi:hypothetical protein
MKIKTLLLCGFIAFFLTPTLTAQFKKSSKKSDCNQVISLRFGAHHIGEDGGSYGSNIGFGIENVMNRHWTFGIELTGFQNKSGFSILDNKQKPIEDILQHKVALSLNFNLYPLDVLHDFYLGGSFGAVYTTKVRDNKPLRVIEGVPQLTSGIETIGMAHFGYQYIYKKSGFVWNIFGGAGLVLPIQIKGTIPIFEFGLKLGKIY